MKKIKLQENQKQDFLSYSKNRIGKCSTKNYHHLNESILEKTFDFMIKHKLTVEENARSYYFMSNRKEMLCYGYSGISINERDNIEGMIENLYHEAFCKAEWIARSAREGYQNIVKETIGNGNYNLITT